MIIIPVIREFLYILDSKKENCQRIVIFFTLQGGVIPTIDVEPKDSGEKFLSGVFLLA
jgi:hypothetical protein